MMTNLFSLNNDPGNRHVSLEEEQESIHPDQHELNIADGSEFLDDAIRMKEQPLDEIAMKEHEQ